MIFGKGKDECWVCRRKVSEDGIFLTSTNLQEVFTGIFKNFDVNEEFKNLCVCEVCAGIVKILASEPVQARMAISKAKIDIKDKLGVGKEKIGSILKRK
ncbi:MAG: hypothetical protein ACFFAU_07480 [Candidatus Hodarchaeota archaeon]